MQLFAHICNAVTMKLDKHQLSYLLLVPLLPNKNAVHKSQNTHSLIVLFLWLIPLHLNFANVSEHTVCSFEDGTNRVFRNIGKYDSNAGKASKRKNTMFRTWQNFEIKKHTLLRHHSQFVHHSNNNTLQSVYAPHVRNTIICTKDCN